MQSHRPPIGIARPSRRAALVVVSVIGAVVLSVIGVSLTSSVASATSCAGPLSAGEIRVVMVVDMGDAGSSNAVCLVVPEGTTGSQLIARRAAELGTASPRYAGSGLLCAIDGFPASGCGDRNAGGFAYWAYFAGTSGSWQYGNFNPFVKRLHDGDIEGWRYVNGAGDGQDPAPRTWPSASLFPSLAPAVPAPTAEGSPYGAGASVAPSATSSSPVPDANSTSPGAEGSTTAVDPAGTSAPTSNGDSAASTGGEVGDVALAASSSSGGSDVGRWIGAIVIAVLICAFGAGAWFRTRGAS